MSLTYTNETAVPNEGAIFTPSYARRAVKQKKLRTWMILTPIGAIALIAGGAAVLMNAGQSEPQPLVEPAASTSVMERVVTAPVASDVVAPDNAASVAPARPAPIAAKSVSRESSPIVTRRATVSPTATRTQTVARTTAARTASASVSADANSKPAPTPVEASGTTSSMAPAQPVVSPVTATPTAPAPIVVMAPQN